MKTDDAKPRSTADVWVTRDGTAIPVRLMRDSHLMNAIRYLVRNAARIKQATVERLEELHCTLEELELGSIDLHQLAPEPDSSPLKRALASCKSTDEIGDLLDCIEVMNGDETLRAVVVTWPRLVLEARRRGLIGGRPQRDIGDGARQLAGDVENPGAMKRVDVRVEPTRKGWNG